MKKNIALILSICLLATSLVACAAPANKRNDAASSEETIAPEPESVKSSDDAIVESAESLGDSAEDSSDYSGIYSAYYAYLLDLRSKIQKVENKYADIMGEDYAKTIYIGDICGDATPEMAFAYASKCTSDGSTIIDIDFVVVGLDGDAVNFLFRKDYVVGAGGGSAYSLVKAENGDFYLASASTKENQASLEYLCLSQDDISRAAESGVYTYDLYDSYSSYQEDGIEISKEDFEAKTSSFLSGSEVCIDNAMQGFFYVLPAELTAVVPTGMTYDEAIIWLDGQFSPKAPGDLEGYYTCDNYDNGADLHLYYENGQLCGELGFYRLIGFSFVAIEQPDGSYRIDNNSLCATMTVDGSEVIIEIDEDFPVYDNQTAKEFIGQNTFAFAR